MKNKFQNFKGFYYLIPILLLISIFTFIPLIYSLLESFKVSQDGSQIKYMIGFNNYLSLFENEDFKVAIKNSTFLFFIATPISILISFTFALLINSLFSRFSQNLFITILYSQFFISSFAIGICFSLLFGEKNLLLYWLGSDKSFIRGNNALGVMWVYLIFQIWRSLPFNIVIFSFYIQKTNRKYFKVMKIDNLNLKDKIFKIYLKEMKTTFLLILYTNAIFAFMFFPASIVGDVDLTNIKGHTITSFIFTSISPLANNINFDFYFAATTSIVSLLYVMLLITLIYLIYNFVFQKIIKLIHRKSEVQDE